MRKRDSRFFTVLIVHKNNVAVYRLWIARNVRDVFLSTSKGAHLDRVLLYYIALSQSVESEVFEYVPLGNGLPALGKHLVPVLHFHRAGLGTEHQLADLVVPTQPVVVHDVVFAVWSRDVRSIARYGGYTRSEVVVHDADDEARVTNALVRHGERERFVEHGIQRLLMIRATDQLGLLTATDKAVGYSSVF